METTSTGPAVTHVAGMCTVTATAQVSGIGIVRSRTDRRRFTPDTLKVVFTLLPDGTRSRTATLHGRCETDAGTSETRRSWCYADHVLRRPNGDAVPSAWLAPYLEWPVITVGGGAWSAV